MDHSDHSKGMAMSMVFDTSTEITLFFHGWTTTTAASYSLTLIFLFALAVFNRFLGVLKFQLDVKHTRPAERGVPKLQLPSTRRRHAIPKDRMSPLPQYMKVAETDPDHEASFPSAPFLEWDPEHTRDEFPSSLNQESQGPLFKRRWWSAYRRWSWRWDGTSSLLEGLRALVGYALMLAVMTFNVGVFCAVVGGIVVGELLLGRYAQPSSGWQDGACHD
ncbi:putative copper transporter crmD [Aspergillus novofumigatus IBT 16806]|uniref:Copper transport protein n=1 Tax=Aspergillus novofumigatus (strain IBT 16806) TaxID=1392255 RepID=A0A2I1BTY3_ASPN1|nr:Ctr copper transporter family protein [Aspergillus novofumigatus IBT 16806]PKX88816.1 Ctr copper transporter family protein [Aspergillus novofumigatus IBT 16806]